MKYAVDFDGILYDGENVSEDVANKIKELRDNGDEVIIYTSRTGDALEEVAELIKDAVEVDEIVGGKTYADAYIDDRGMSREAFLNIEIDANEEDEEEGEEENADEEKGEEKREAFVMKDGREYRSMTIKRIEKREEGADPDYKVRGYASTFDTYPLFEYDGVTYYERIEPTAFDEADMTDVIFLYNHEGMVYARKKNGTLDITVDEKGLLSVADLSSTTQSRELFEAIESGLVDQMSFAFTVTEESYNKDTHTRTIQKVGKVYDVSAVSIPANPYTSIAEESARRSLDGVIKAEQTERSKKREALERAKTEYFKKRGINDGN